MAGEARDSKGVAPWVISGSALLAAAIGALAVYLYAAAGSAAGELETRKEEYAQMARMKKAVDEHRQTRSRPPPAPEGPDDLLKFLSTKAREARVPAELFNLRQSPAITVGAWSESGYTVQLRAAKDGVIERGPIVDFLRRVEEERPSIKVKNLNLAFSKNDFSAVTITLSSFSRK